MTLDQGMKPKYQMRQNVKEVSGSVEYSSLKVSSLPTSMPIEDLNTSKTNFEQKSRLELNLNPK